MLPHLESEDPGNMKNRKSLLHRCFGLLLLVIATGVHAGQDDGPYARYTVQGLEVKWLKYFVVKALNKDLRNAETEFFLVWF